MQLFYSDTFVLPLPPGHRFPMEKYARLRQTLLDEGYPPADFILARGRQPRGPLPGPRSGLRGTGLQRPADAGGNAPDPSLVGRHGGVLPPGLAGATLGACRAALAEGWGVNLAGGTHHGPCRRRRLLRLQRCLKYDNPAFEIKVLPGEK